MITRQNLSLLPLVKLPAARKALSSIVVIHPLHQVWHHPWILVSCLIQPFVSRTMWTKFVKILTISGIPSVKLDSTLTSPHMKKMINSAVTSRLDYWNSLQYGIDGYSVSHHHHRHHHHRHHHHQYSYRYFYYHYHYYHYHYQIKARVLYSDHDMCCAWPVLYIKTIWWIIFVVSITTGTWCDESPPPLILAGIQVNPC